MLKPLCLNFETSLAFLNSLQDALIAVNHQSQIIFCNEKAFKLLGESPDILLTPETPSAYQVFDPNLRQLGKSELPLQRVLAGETLQDLELLISPPDRSQTLWLSISGGPIQDWSEGGGLIAVRDISERKQREAQTLQDILHDELTGLPNRSLFIDRMGHALARARHRQQDLMAVLFIDLDRFKSVNDNLGHQVGNQLLAELGQRLQTCLRPEDTVGRLGGDEFAVLLEGLTTCSAAVEVAEQLRQTISEPFPLLEHEVYIDASIGIAMGSSEYVHPEDWLRDADIAMYRAKENPETYWQMFDNSMQIQQDERLQLEMALRKALTQDELRLHYQPIVTLSSQEVIGFEALVRWHHPEKGLLPPSEFIPIAEASGLIIPLGWWVIKEACRQMQAWSRAFPSMAHLTISVNMSSKQFSQKYLTPKIQSILDETGFSPQRLRLEITESVLIDHSDSIIETLEQIQRMGIKLSIDDFGTGYSSLSYLHRFPFDSLKIDRSFIENADQNYEKLEILQSVVRLAWNLGLDVIAEGVETQRHYAQLKALRCESGQGYLFSRPLPPDAVESLLHDKVQST